MIKLKNWDKLEKKLINDPNIKSTYDTLENNSEFSLMDAMVAAHKNGLTQAEIARKMGTTQSAISRAFSTVGNPSVKFLQRFAKAAGLELKIQFT